MRELIEQRMLSRTGYQYRYQPVRFYLPQKVERTGHNRRYTFGNKVLALAGIYHLLLVLVGIATVSTIENQIDGRCAVRPSYIKNSSGVHAIPNEEIALYQASA